MIGFVVRTQQLRKIGGEGGVVDERGRKPVRLFQNLNRKMPMLYFTALGVHTSIFNLQKVGRYGIMGELCEA